MTRSEEIALSLEREIRSGGLSGKLPSEKVLAGEFAVAVMTISNAMDILKSKGLIRQVHRRGTFAVPPEKKVLRMFCASPAYLACQYPERLLHGIDDVELERADSLDDADLAVFSTTLPMNYSSHFMPWPAALVGQLRESGKFYDQAFEFHHIGTPVYAAAYSFSPTLIAYNKELMKKFFPEFDPYNFTYNDLVVLLQKLPEEVLPSRHSANALLLSLAYAAGSLEKALADFQKLRLADRKNNFSGNEIFTEIIRNHVDQLPENGAYNFMPIPDFNGSRCCHASSEAVFVPLSCRYPERAFQVAANTLNDHFQQAVALRNGNLPVNRALAAGCLNSRTVRDDIFFNEIANIHYPREIIDPLSAAVILEGLKKLAGMAITAEDFFELLQIEKDMLNRREHAIENILKTRFAI